MQCNIFGLHIMQMTNDLSEREQGKIERNYN